MIINVSILFVQLTVCVVGYRLAGYYAACDLLFFFWLYMLLSFLLPPLC